MHFAEMWNGINIAMTKSQNAELAAKACINVLIFIPFSKSQTESRQLYILQTPLINRLKLLQRDKN